MKPSEVRAFLVNIPSLKNGHHDFQFEITDEFFTQFEYSLVKKGTGTCELALTKSETMLHFVFRFDVEVELICDRSLDPFLYPIKEEEELRVKFGERNEELSEDLLVMGRETQSFDTAPIINEFIGLAVPMKKLHPRYDQDEEPGLIFQSEDIAEDESETIDPRWEALKKLSNK